MCFLLTQGVQKKIHSFALNNKTDISTSIAGAWCYRAKQIKHSKAAQN